MPRPTPHTTPTRDTGPRPIRLRLLASAALGATVLLAACNGDDDLCNLAVPPPCACPDGSQSFVACFDGRVIGCACEGGSDLDARPDTDDALASDVSPPGDAEGSDGSGAPNSGDASDDDGGETSDDGSDESTTGDTEETGRADEGDHDDIARDVTPDSESDNAEDARDDRDDVTADARVDAAPESTITCADLERAPQAFLGCTFWAVDLPSYDDPFGDPIGPPGVVVTNPGPRDATIRFSDLGSTPEVLPSFVLEPGASRAVELPNRDLTATEATRAAIRIDADRPVLASQLNPLQLEGGGDIGASRLRPASAAATTFRAVSRPAGSPVFDFPAQRGFVVVVATRDATRVAVTPSTTVDDGPGITGWGEGDTRAFDLDEGEAFALFATSPLSGPQRDLTGTLVRADKPVTMFSGHEQRADGRGIDGGVACCADRLEEQMPPVASWGTSYVATRTATRGEAVPETWIVVADTAASITTSPSIAGLDGQTISAGRAVVVTATRSFELTATTPVLLARITHGREAVGVVGEVGDPALTTLAPASAEWLYHVADMPAGGGTRWVTVATPTGGDVLIDGVPQPAPPAETTPSWDIHTFLLGPRAYSIATPAGALGVISVVEPAGGADMPLGSFSLLRP